MRQDHLLKMPHGLARAWLFRPDTAIDRPLRGVLFYMDGVGPRPSLFAKAQRLADAGYTVLLADLFYREGPSGPAPGRTFADIMRLIDETSQDMTQRDTAVFLGVLAAEGLSGPVGAVGYCTGGGRALTAAARYPDQIRAVASFHGGDLATDAPDSPHRIVDRITAQVYVGVAETDKSFPAEQSGRLAEALRRGGVDHILETYAGTVHGWTMPDFNIYHETATERHWKRLLTLFDEALA
jgi:carboxymethylenebutenolidase